mmetsp:Transcript_33476/g.99778  ORF Transcript_33476/g.99778 Transcript_33476/m.99778 type:complete len:711 (-) Transcript_33476:2676-4808(-)
MKVIAVTMRRPEKHFLCSAFFATVAICTEGANSLNSEVDRATSLGWGGKQMSSVGITRRTRTQDMTRNALIAGKIAGLTILTAENKDLMDEADIKEILMKHQMGNNRRKLERHDKDANSKDAENIEPNFPVSSTPSSVPTDAPSASPTSIPSTQPSTFPSATPSTSPSSTPSIAPTVSPSTAPSAEPSYVPSLSPSAHPSVSPSSIPSSVPTDVPSASPTSIPSTQPSTFPSATPSTSPSSTPSIAPTVSPSTAPSAEPSHVPTSVPSVVPSVVPSAVPTSPPSDEPSGAPSAVPSLVPSMHPTLMPSLSPSAAPSGEPSLQPSSTPTIDCYLNSDGSFGNVSGTTERIVIDYDYEVEVNTTVQSDMIPAVETAINDALLPVLFNDLCQSENDTRRALQQDGKQPVALRGMRRLQGQVVGMSPNPLDMIQTDEPCLNEAKIKSGSSCVVVRGALSVYGSFTSEDDETQTRVALIDTVQAGMEGGAFASTHPSIVRIFFVERSISTPLIDTQEARFADIRADSRGAFSWVVISCISTVFVVGIMYGWNKFSKKKKQQGADDVDHDAEDALSAKRSLPPLDLEESPEVCDSANSWRMRGVGVEEVIAISSYSDETQDTPEVIGASYGVAAAQQYLRRLPPGGSQSTSADEMEFSSIALSAEDASASVGDVDGMHSPLGMSPRNQFKRENIARANSILFSRRKIDFGDAEGEI